MLVKQKEESTTWEGPIGLKIKEKVMLKITKGEAYPVNPLTDGVFVVCIGKSIFNVDIMNRTCSCKAWQILGIPCEHDVAHYFLQVTTFFILLRMTSNSQTKS